MSAFDRLILQIDSFIRKYYINEIIKGLVLFVGILLCSFLLVTFLEYIGRFNSYVRGVLFFGFITINLYIFGRYLLTSIVKLSSFGKRINRKQAAGIIGTFFPQISDRLINTLQLNESGNEGNFELIRASVIQRSTALDVFNFSEAIDLSRNKKFAKWLIPILAILISVAIVAPKILTQGTERVLNYNKQFIPEAPFEFLLLNNGLLVEEGDDANVEVKIIGSTIPDKVYLISDQGKFLMKWKTKNEADYMLSKLSENLSFYFEANGFKSEVFALGVLPKSAIGKLEAIIHYPSYLSRKNEVIQNSGDLNVPEGTTIEWSFLTKNTKKVTIYDGVKNDLFTSDGFKFKRTILNDLVLKVRMENIQTSKIDSVRMSIVSIRDAFPSIVVKESKDSVSDGLRFFSGNISDDYGLSALSFRYKVISKSGATREESLSVLSPRGTDMSFDFGVDFRREKLQIEDKIEYYFLVSDNDGVNGKKTSKSQLFVYQLPMLEELNEDRDKNQEETKDDLLALLNKTKEFQKNVDRLKKEIMNSKSVDWKAKNQLEKLKADQLELNQSLQNLQENMKNSKEEKNQLSEMDPLLLEKQAEIEELMKELMDDEMLDLLKRLEDLMKVQNKDEIQNELEKLDRNTEDFNKQLDRSLEMLKKLQVNEKIDDIEKELKELAEEQLNLKKDIEEDRINSEKGKIKQDELNEKFDEIKKDLDELKKLNEALERPLNLEDQKEDQEKITNEMEEASGGLEKNKKGKAGEKQEQSAEDLKKLADDLNKMQEEANAEQEGEDIELLRRILKSLMSLSFDQEKVMKNFSKVNDSDPLYKLYGRKQRSIIDDTKTVKDSLEALAKRQPKIATFVDGELNEIEKNHFLSLEDIDEHRKKELGQHQQYVMTSYNNLALLLNESLESMQKAARDSKPGSGSCDKPGGKGKPKPGNGSPGAADMKQMLKKQLEAMEKGKSPGGNKPGEKSGGNLPGGKNGDPIPGLGNKQISKMAAEQSAIRQKLEQIRDELNKEGQGKGNGLNPLINELDKQERELLSRNFSSEMISRQKNILTRLLDSEKALLERGFEEKRESKTGINREFGNQIRFDEYNKEKLRQVELIRSVDPVLRKYYKDKANEYFNLTM
jgi:hypothetical protein